jgi:3-oxoacyl-[acyl-carrier-protein] synthase-3
MMQRPAAEIVAIEYSLPKKVETNEELRALYPHWDIDAVAKKTGVFQRHVARAEECASDLAYSACLRLFEAQEILPAEIDGLLVCTQSADYVMPPTATLLQHRLGLNKSVAAFDYTLACSGYVYGLAMCKAFIESGLLRSILLVTCDTYSKYIRPDDRATRTLFGDGAAVTLIRKGTPGICEVGLATDGSGGEKFIVRGGGCRNGSRPGERNATGTDVKHIEMDGLGVISFVKKEIPSFTENLLRKANLRREDIDLFIFHQASKISLDQVSQILGIPPEKTFINFANIGNTVSSSIPIAIKDAWQGGKLKPGMVATLVGFGVGFSWGGALVRWTNNFRGGLG